MKKFLPIKIHSSRHGYGWWWGSYTFFFKLHFAIGPIWWELDYCVYAKNGKAIADGDDRSWNRYQEQFK